MRSVIGQLEESCGESPTEVAYTTLLTCARPLEPCIRTNADPTVHRHLSEQGVTGIFFADPNGLFFL